MKARNVAASLGKGSMVAMALATASVLIPFGVVELNQLTLEPKTAFFRNLIFWSFEGKLIHCLGGLAFMTAGLLALRRRNRLGAACTHGIGVFVAATIIGGAAFAATSAYDLRANQRAAAALQAQGAAVTAEEHK
jgi:hypothetical protein